MWPSVGRIGLWDLGDLSSFFSHISGLLGDHRQLRLPFLCLTFSFCEMWYCPPQEPTLSSNDQLCSMLGRNDFY